MSLCINPSCPQPDHPGNDSSRFCESCGSDLILQQRYRVLRLLSDKSGFGKVYEAYERSVPKILKVLKETYTSNPKAVELFQQEAMVLGQLRHPGIPLIEPNGYFQFVPRNGSTVVHCIIMEKIDGPNLREWMRQQGNHPISEKQALNWLQQMVEILHLVHQKNYFHRDIKPENIMLRSTGQLVLVDFGAAREMTYTYLAHLSGGSSGVTRISSAGYTPPEQEYGQAVPQSDFYALGRTFIYLLTGKLPTDVDVYDHLNNELKWREYAPRISPQLANFMDKLIAPKAGDRPKNTQEILEELAQLSSQLAQAQPNQPGRSANSATVVNEATVPQRSTFVQEGSRLKRKWLWGGAAALLIALGGFGGWQVYQNQRNIAANGVTETISVVEVLSGHMGEVKCLILGPGGTNQLISGGVDGTIRIWDLGTKTFIRKLTGHTSYINALIISPNGKSLISAGADETLRIWDLETGQNIRTLKDSSFVNAVVVSPDGKTLASGNADGTIRFWDFASGQEIKTLKGHESAVNSLVYTPDGKYLASGSADSTVKLWDAKTGEVVHTFTGHTSYVNAIAVSPDGRMLMSASADNTIKIWDVQAGILARTLTGHSSFVNALRVSPDGRTIISSSADGTIKVWDLSNGHILRTFVGYGAPIDFFVVDANRQIMASGSKSKDIRVWTFQ
ncbi:MAG TPA: serine/threonine-protein kinase [Crinalium sp.]|jgi:WD40 repeat protein/serine/threonine protein kinase